MNPTSRTIAALTLAAATSQAFALGLGPIVVKSQLDEPLIAEIPVIGASPDEAAGLEARVGSPSELERGGLDAARGSSAVELQVVEGRDGRPVIRVTTRNAVHDPLVSFLVNVSWPSGRLVREYSVALPSRGGAPSPVSQAAPEPERAPQAESIAESKPTAKPVAAAPVVKATPSPSAPPAAIPAEPKSAPPKAVVAESKPAPAKSTPPVAPAPAKPAAAAPMPAAAPPKPTQLPAPAPAPAKPVVAEAKPVASPPKPEAPPAKSAPVATVAPPPAAPAADKTAPASTELDRAKAELAAKESDTATLKARVEELERSQPTNRQRLEEENRKLAEAERQLNEMAREATAQQEALAQVQAQTQVAAPPAAPAADAPPTAAAGSAGESSATGTEAAAISPAPAPDAAEPSPAPRPERSMLDQWLIPGALGLLALLGALFAFSRKRAPKPVAAVPAQPVAELEPDFDLSDADAEMPIDLAADAAAQPEASGAANEGESQFDMLRLFYLRGDSAGFEETARFMREHNADPELWRRVAEMGRMLAPENPLYADPSAPRTEFDLPDLQPPRPAETMVGQDFEDEFLFDAEPASAEPAAPAEGVEHTLEPFAFEETPPPPMDEVATMAMPALAPLPEALPTEPEPESAEAEPEPPAQAPRAPLETDSSAAHAGGPQDPVDTKLELAQAYLEMGDAEGAQHMLDEVMNEGDSRQKAEAMRLREQAGPAQRRA